MGRNAQPVDILTARGKKHLTKQEIEDRKATEIKLGAADIDKIKPPVFVKNDVVAYKHWKYTWVIRDFSWVDRAVETDHYQVNPTVANPRCETYLSDTWQGVDDCCRLREGYSLAYNPKADTLLLLDGKGWTLDVYAQFSGYIYYRYPPYLAANGKSILLYSTSNYKLYRIDKASKQVALIHSDFLYNKQIPLLKKSLVAAKKMFGEG